MYMCVCFAMTLALAGSSVTGCSDVHKTVSGNEERPAPNANSSSVEKY